MGQFIKNARLLFASLLGLSTFEACAIADPFTDVGGGAGGVAEPECNCVPTPPANWQGPVALYEGASPAPACPNDFPTIMQSANSTLVPGTATCPTCQCDPPTGVACSAELVFFDSPSCAGTNCWGASGFCNGKSIVVTQSTCSQEQLCYGTAGSKPQSALFANSTFAGGACTPNSTGTKDIPTPYFSKTVRACGQGSGGAQSCGAANVCVPTPPAPYNSSPCIYADGDVTCPGGAFSRKTLYYLSYTDTRDCSDCGCGSVAGACTDLSVELYTDDLACTGNQDTISSSGASGCTDLQGDPTPVPSPNCQGGAGDSRTAKLVATFVGSCPPTGGQVTGTVTPIQPVTFCCL